MEAGLVGAVKIKDGLFIGDEFAAQDLEFVVANKVTHIINCAGRQVPNHWEPIGVRYLTYLWTDQDTQVEQRDEVFRDVYAFIEKCSGSGESVLLHSVRELSKPLTLVASYFMRKYRWTMFKSLEFLSSRASALHLAPTFIHQLAALEGKLSKAGLAAKSADWAVTEFADEEEAVLQNTLLNSRLAQMSFATTSDLSASRSEKVKWKDNGSGEATKLTATHPAANNPVDNGFVVLRSALKGKRRDGVRVPLRSAQGKRLGKLKLDYLSDTSRFAKTVETALEYGSAKTSADPPASRIRPNELLSPVFDPSARSKKSRTASADRKDTEAFPAPIKRQMKLLVPDDFVSVSELKTRDTPAAAHRPLRAPIPTGASRSTAILPKAKRPVTAPSNRVPSPKSGDARPRVLGQSKTMGKLPTRWHM